MANPSQAIGRQSASQVLGRIVRAYPGRLTLTGSLVVAENALDLFYPIVAGIAIDAVIAGDLERAFAMVGVIFAFWVVGAARQAIDTRVYARIYADLAQDVVVGQRLLGTMASPTIVRTALARQFVDFFEIQVPAFVTAFVSIIGSVVMLVLLQPIVGYVATGLLVVSILAALGFMNRSEFLAACLHARQELEPAVVTNGNGLRIRRHFRVLAGRRVQLSDLEAGAYLVVGVMAAVLFGALFVVLVNEGGATAGAIYTLVSYVWTFVFSLDDMPMHVQQLGKLRELGSRIAPSLDPENRSRTEP